MDKKCAVIYGGGKDAHLTLIYAIENNYDIECLVQFDAGKTHYTYFSDIRKIKIVREQAKIMGFNLFTCKIPLNLQKKQLKEVLDFIVKNILKKYKVGVIFAGNTEDEDEAKIWEYVGKKNRVKIILPLRRKNIFDIIDTCVAKNVVPIIVSLEKNVDKNFLGKEVNYNFSNYIKIERDKNNYIDGNDFQTLVIKSPFFKGKSMKIDKNKIFSIDTTTYLDIESFKFI